MIAPKGMNFPRITRFRSILLRIQPPRIPAPSASHAAFSLFVAGSISGFLWLSLLLSPVLTNAMSKCCRVLSPMLSVVKQRYGTIPNPKCRYLLLKIRLFVSVESL